MFKSSSVLPILCSYLVHAIFLQQLKDLILKLIKVLVLILIVQYFIIDQYMLSIRNTIVYVVYDLIMGIYKFGFKGYFKNAWLRPKRHIVTYSLYQQLCFNQSNVKTKFVNDHIGSWKNWYTRGKKYWNELSADYNGVLNGYGHLSQKDIEGSKAFFNEFLQNYPKFQCERVLDCGAGIGRISKEFLCNYFRVVDVIDQCEKFIEKARVLLKDQNIGHYYTQGLQQFSFQEKYDCVWVQWVLAQLTEKDAQQFLRKARTSLNKSGVIIVKQNHVEEGFLVDKDDGSVSRSPELYKQLFAKAELQILMQKMQKQWPDDLQQVRMYVLK